MHHHTIIGDPMLQEPLQWQEPPEEKQIAVDPFSLRQFSQLNIDRPLPIPSVSVEAVDLAAPPRLTSTSLPCSAAASPRLSAAAPTKWDAHSTSVPARSRALTRSRSCVSAGGQQHLPDDGDEFDVILSLSERRASAPQRWGSDLPLIGAEGRKNGWRRRAASSDGVAFKCCMYLPRLSRRPSKPPALEATFLGSAAAAESDPGTARPSAMSVAASLERFELRSSSSTSSGLLLDGDGSSYFDLPMELIIGCDDETDLPVHTAFMFDSDAIRKSVLKKKVGGATAWPPRPSSENVPTNKSGRISSRHVRFSAVSTSAPASSSTSSISRG